MVKRIPALHGDETSPACVVAGDYIFLGHHAGGHDKEDVQYQMRRTFQNLEKTLQSAGATFGDMVQINLYLKNIEDFRPARDIFHEFFKNGFPTRMTSTTEFIPPTCLCMVDGIAYKKLIEEDE